MKMTFNVQLAKATSANQAIIYSYIRQHVQRYSRQYLSRKRLNKGYLAWTPIPLHKIINKMSFISGSTTRRAIKKLLEVGMLVNCQKGYPLIDYWVTNDSEAKRIISNQGSRKKNNPKDEVRSIKLS